MTPPFARGERRGRVLVVGSVNVDLVVTLPRLPASGETLGGGLFARHQGGKGGNKASAVARLGVPCRLAGCVGDDDEGRAAVEALRADGVDTGDVRVTRAHTGVASILVDAAGANLIALAPGANALVTPGQAATAAGALRPGDVLLADLEVPLAAVVAAARAASGAGAAVVLDPAPAQPLPAELIAGCDVLLPNEHEAAVLGDPARLLAAGAGAVVVTRGAAGCDVHTARGTSHHGALRVEAVDTTGAGDAFAAGLAAALARGAALDAAVRCGTRCGAETASAPGARGGALAPALLAGT